MMKVGKKILIFFLHTYLLFISQCYASRILSDEERKIAEKYLQEYSESNSWVDPYDMFGDEPLSVGETITKPQGEDARETEVTLNVDINSKMTEHLSTDDWHQRSPLDTESSQEIDTMDVFSVSKENTCVSSDYVFLTRWLKKFLHKVKDFTQYSSSSEKIISFTLTDNHVSKIGDILENSKPNMVDVEPVILDILNGATVTVTKSWFSLPQISFHFLANEKLTYLAAILAIVCVIVILSRYFSYPPWLFCLIVVVISVGFQWKQLYEEAIAKKAAIVEKIDYQTACRRADFTILESMAHYIKNIFVTSGSCEEYYKATLVDPLWDVSLMKAFSLTFSKFVFAPLEALAQSLNVVLKELFSDLSPVAVCFVTFFIFGILIMLCNYRVRFPYFFAYLEPSVPAAVINNPQERYSMNRALRCVGIVNDGVLPLMRDDSLMVEQSDSNKALVTSSGSESMSNMNLCSKCRHEVVQDTKVENEIALVEDATSNIKGAVSKMASTNNSSLPHVTELTSNGFENCVDLKETSKKFTKDEESLDDKPSLPSASDLKGNYLLETEKISLVECFNSSTPCGKCTLKCTEAEVSN